MSDGHELDFVFELFARLHVFGGNHDFLEAHFDAFVHAFFRKVHAAHFARQAHFAEEGGVFIDGDHAFRACKRRAYGKVGARLVQLNAAHGVEVNVLRSQGQSTTLFEDGNQNREAAGVYAQGHSSGEPVGGLCHERLDFHHHAAVARDARRDRRARRYAAAVGEKERGVVGNSFNSLARHFEYAHLLHGAEAVFDGAKNFEVFRVFAFEVEHGVHDVFEHLGTRNRALLGDVTDDEKGDSAGLCNAHQPARAFPDLRNASRRGGERLGVHCLNTVDNHVFRV